MRTFLASLLVVVSFGTLPAFGQEPNPWLARRFLNIAHRGGRFEAPEHTTYAYRRALHVGTTVLEIDVHLSADGVLVVSHDATVDRVTSGSGEVGSFTVAELKALDAAYWFSSLCEGTCRNHPDEDYDFRGVATGDVSPPAGFAASDFQIPTMREVLETFPGILMSIEIKGEAPASVPAAEALADLLTEFGRMSDVMIASFDPATTAAFKARAPMIHTTPAEDEILSFLADPESLGDHVAFQVPRTFSSILVAPLLIPPATANGLPVIFFLDRDEETADVYHELIDAGAGGIITDRPSALQAVLDSRRVGYAYPQPLQTKHAVLKTRPLAKLALRGLVTYPRLPIEDGPTILTVQSNGGELVDDLTGGEWRAVGNGPVPKRYEYANRAAPTGGPCKRVVVTPRGVSAVCRDIGSIPPPLAAGENGDVVIDLRLGIDRYCGIGTAPHRKAKAGRLIKIKRAAPPDACLALGS